MGQMSYKFVNSLGKAGGIVDLAPNEVNAYANYEATGTMEYGIGVIVASKTVTTGTGDDAVSTTTVYPDSIMKPVAGTTAAKFLGITVNGLTTQRGLDGETYIPNKASVGVMRYGKIWAKVATGISPAVGDNLYLVISGDDAGKFTNASGSTAVQVKGRFDSTASNGVARVTLYDTPQA